MLENFKDDTEKIAERQSFNFLKGVLVLWQQEGEKSDKRDFKNFLFSYIT